MKKIIIIGGGPAGMLAAIYAAKNGNNVTLLEKNNVLGKKLRITGKGKCNITNYCEMDELFQNINTNSKFLFSAFYQFSNFDVFEMFEKEGLNLNVERGKRVFPKSNKAIDVQKTLEKMLTNEKVNIKYNTKVVEVLTKERLLSDVENKKKQKKQITGVKLQGGHVEEADMVIVATGGLSYPKTGSTGDGYKFAKNTGHKLVPTRASLSALKFSNISNLSDYEMEKLFGLKLKNVSVKLLKNDKCIFEEFGEMEIQKYGLDGPIIKTISCKIDEIDKADYKLVLDLKPALSVEKLDNRIQRDFKEFNNKLFKDSLNKLIYKTLIELVIKNSGITRNKVVNQITKEERLSLVNAVKNIEIDITDFRPIEEAIITVGGVDVKNINPKTMESKIVKGMYFVGEVLDVDGYTGGFNLQIAFSTGYLAGIDK